ncbi:MAG TPA: hypothetical protein VGF16_18250 [Bryobacteraceae bacterium]|jgi:hypothetical protein
MQAWNRVLGFAMLLAMAAAAPLRADPIFVAFDFSIAFIPPNPITPPNPIFGPFTGGVLHIQNDLTPNFDQPLILNVIDIALPTMQAGETLVPPNPIIPPNPITPPNPIVPPDPVLPSGLLEMSLTGFSGAFPVIAFGANDIVPNTIPPNPVIPIGAFGENPALGSQLTAGGFLYAYDAPVPVGTWSLTATVVAAPSVPEPAAAALALMISGLLAVAAMRRRWRREA